jgi:hypothetical protein
MVPPVIDVIAEPILALPGLTNTRDGAGGWPASGNCEPLCGVEVARPDAIGSSTRR